MAQKVNGITIAINADTSGVTSGLKDLTAQSVSLSKQLKTVDSLLKIDPSNTELLAQKQELLAKSAEVSAKKLQALKDAQEDVKKAVASGSIGTDEYLAFQKELVTTEKRLKDVEQQSAETGEDVDKLGDETKETGKQMQTASKESSDFGEKLKSGLAAGAKVAAAALAAVGAASVATAKKLIDAAGDAAEYGDNVDKMSQKLGLSAQAYQEWDFIMQHAGSDVDKMSTSMKKLAESVQDPSKDAAAAFERLGINLEEAKNLSQEDLFAKVITELQGMESGTERTALAADLLGKSAMDLGALLNMSAEDTENMRKQVHDLGGVMSDEGVAAAAAYQDSLQNMKTAMQGAARSVSGQYMPAITKMMDGFAGLVSGNDEAIDSLEEGINEFIDNLEQSADKIAEYADRLIPVIVDAIVRNLPKLLDSAMKIVKTLASSLLDAKNLDIIITAAGKIILNIANSLLKALPRIIEVGLQLVTKLAQGIAQALPDLIPVAIDAIMQIVKALTDPANLMPLIHAAFDIINALVEGLLNEDSINLMIEMVPQVVENVVDILVDSIDLLLDAATKIIEALCDYFFEPGNLQKIFDANVRIMKKIVEGLIKVVWRLGEAAEKIISKLTEKLSDGWERIKQAGRDMIQKLFEGITEKWDQIKGWFQTIGDYIHNIFNPDTSAVYAASSAIPQGGRPFATGGIITRPTRALIGENGMEAVVPLERNTGWIDILAEKINSGTGGGGISINAVNVYAYGADGINNIGDAVVKQLDSALRNYQITQNRGVGAVVWDT